MIIYKISLDILKRERHNWYKEVLHEESYRDFDGKLESHQYYKDELQVENRYWLEINVYSANLPVGFTLPTRRRLPVEKRNSLNRRFDDHRELNPDALDWKHEGAFDPISEDLDCFGEGDAILHDEGYVTFKSDYNRKGYEPKYVIVDGCKIHRVCFCKDVLSVHDVKGFESLIESL